MQQEEPDLASKQRGRTCSGREMYDYDSKLALGTCTCTVTARKEYIELTHYLIHKTPRNNNRTALGMPAYSSAHSALRFNTRKASSPLPTDYYFLYLYMPFPKVCIPLLRTSPTHGLTTGSMSMSTLLSAAGEAV